jgi:hypothetical protein
VIVRSSARITPFPQLDAVHLLRRSADGEQIGASGHVAPDAEANLDHRSARRRGPDEARAIERGHHARAALVADHGGDRRVLRDRWRRGVAQREGIGLADRSRGVVDDLPHDAARAQQVEQAADEPVEGEHSCEEQREGHRDGHARDHGRAVTPDAAQRDKREDRRRDEGAERVLDDRVATEARDETRRVLARAELHDDDGDRHHEPGERDHPARHGRVERARGVVLEVQ